MKKNFYRLTFESFSENRKEIVKELKDVIWRLEHGLTPNSSVVKLNFGKRKEKLEELTVDTNNIYEESYGVKGK